MPKRKKEFPCGHKGYGQKCHRCAHENALREQKISLKRQWKSTFEEDLIDLSALPRNVVLKARRIINALQGAQTYRDFRGKRLRHDRSVISIPVTRNYRLLCQDLGTAVLPQAVISHEDYNVCKPGN
ncbi:MAG: hypothetical protein AAGG02_03220 [Cyanobacteria bacterium P01_H01_bin.15]